MPLVTENMAVVTNLLQDKFMMLSLNHKEKGHEKNIIKANQQMY